MADSKSGSRAPTTPWLIDSLYFGAPQAINIAGIGTRAFQDAKNYFFGSQDKDGRELAFKYAIPRRSLRIR